MKYEIDQSGKIERTEKNTAIAYSNGTQFALLIPKKLKRQMQELFRSCGATQYFIYYLFAIGIYYLTCNLKKSTLIIDIEYPGKDRLIKSLLEKLFKELKTPVHEIYFRRIGNHPPVHYAAKNVYDKKKTANRILKYKEVIIAIKKTDGRLRECLSTLVDAQARSITGRYHNKVLRSSHNFRFRRK